MTQSALIYLHATARRQIIIWFRCRASHEFNFNIQFQLPTFLYAMEYNTTWVKSPTAILRVNSLHIQCSHVIQTQARNTIQCNAMQCNTILDLDTLV